jgi:hypothetical protein
MSKKQLTNPTLQNDLREGSVFFRRPDTAPDTPPTPAATQEPPYSTRPKTAGPAPNAQPMPQAPAPTQSSSHEITPSRHHDITMSRYDDRLIEDIRKAVKVIGREPGTIRLTAHEKSQLTDIIYTLSRQGSRTSENELYRIAINHLLGDWRQHGKESVLARVLAALDA